MTRAGTVFLAVAMAVGFGGLLVTPDPPAWWRLAFAVAAMVVAQQLVLHLRVGAAVLTLVWSEAALVVTLVLVPAGWVPLTFAAGALVGVWLHRLRHRQPAATAPPARAAASVGVAAALATGVAYAVAEPYASELTPGTAAGLVAAAIAYLLAGALMASLVGAAQYRMSVTRLLGRALSSKLLMFTGNVTLGLTVIAAGYADWRWLLGLPLLVWLLHRTYGHRLRVSEQRRMWGAFAQATRSLNQADEAAVAQAGVQGAVEVFAVGQVEMELRDRHGLRRTWTGDQTGAVRETVVSSARTRRPPLLPSVATPTAVPLVVGGDEVGELRVHFPAVAGPGPGEESALQAYGDALAAAVHDATTHQELHRMLAHSASDAQHDPLTGLYNRAALLTRGETELQLAPRPGEVALLLVDVDHFREINETLGHAAGDQVLRVTARRLRGLAQPGELLARLGGDEFALLMTSSGAGPDGTAGAGAGPDGTAGAGAGPGGTAGGPAAGAGPDAEHPVLRRGRSLAQWLAEAAEIGGVPVSIDVSVGVVVAAAGTADLAELLRRAGSAMRQGRSGRGGRAGWYDPAHDPDRVDRPALLADLQLALARQDELVLVLQPVVDLATNAPIELEALVRWRHPQRGLLLPAEFVRVVEHSDLLARFTEYVVDQALAVAARQAVRGPVLPVAVNLSARSLLDPRLPQTVARLLRRHRLPGRKLVLEITETVVASELPGIEEALARLRSLGVRLAVDDFGTGPASLALLTRVPLDEVKIDAAFVAQMTSSAAAAAIVRTTVELGRELGLRVVAEGVETPEQRALLTQLGCPAGQGFSIAEPVPAERLDGAGWLTPSAIRPG